MPISLSVQVQQFPQAQHRDDTSDSGDIRYGRGIKCGRELASGASGDEVCLSILYFVSSL